MQVCLRFNFNRYICENCPTLSPSISSRSKHAGFFQKTNYLHCMDLVIQRRWNCSGVIAVRFRPDAYSQYSVLMLRIMRLQFFIVSRAYSFVLIVRLSSCIYYAHVLYGCRIWWPAIFLKCLLNIRYYIKCRNERKNCGRLSTSYIVQGNFMDISRVKHKVHWRRVIEFN